MITPFDTPAESPVVSMADTYVPIPFQEMAQAGAMRQDRIEQTLTLEDTATDQLSQVGGLSTVQLPGMTEALQLEEGNKAKSIVADYTSRIEQLGDELPDAASPQRKAKIRALLTGLKQDLSPNGRLGILQGNEAQLKDLYARMQSNEDLANNPHKLVPYINTLKEHAEASATGNIRKLNLQTPIGDRVDVSGKLMDVLKNMGSTILKETTLQRYSNDLPGLYAAIQETGVSADRIASTALMLMQSDPEIQRDIQQQVEYSNMTGNPKTEAEIIEGYISPMINTFMENDRKITYKENSFEANAMQRSLDKQTELGNLYATPTVLPKIGNGIETMSDLKEAKTMASATVKETKDAHDLYLKSIQDSNYGGKEVFTKNADGTTNYRVVDPITEEVTDYSRTARQYVDAIINAQAKEVSLNNYEDDLRTKSGYTKKYTNTSAYKQSYKLAREKAVKKANTESWRKAAYNPHYEFDQKKHDKDIETYTAENIKKIDPKVARYHELLKESSKNSTFVAGVTALPEKDTQQLTDIFINNFSSSEYAAGSITEITNEGEKELDSDEYDGLRKNIGALVKSDARKRVQLLGFYSDDNSGGEVKLIYNILDSDGKMSKRVKVDPPVNFVNSLVSRGYINDAKLYIKRKLYSELGALGKNATSSIITFEPDLETEDVDLTAATDVDKKVVKDLETESVEPMVITVTDKNASATQKPSIKYKYFNPTTGEDENIVKDFNTDGEMINYLTNLNILYLQSNAKQEAAKK